MDDDLDYLMHQDIPFAQEEAGKALARPSFGDAGCKSCGETPGSFVDHLKAQWNAGLGIEEVRLCHRCGSTKLCKRVKDEPNKYNCGASECQ